MQANKTKSCGYILIVKKIIITKAVLNASIKFITTISIFPQTC